MPDIDIAPISGGSGRLRGYLSRPTGSGAWPGVVVIHELFGVTDQVRRHTDRMAAAGYLALAPDLFTEGGALRCLVATFRTLNSGRGKAVADIDAARRYLQAAPECTGKVGIIGFCMGGGFALLMAGTHDFDASAVNYGQLPPDPEETLRDACPIVGSYGARDPSQRGVAAKLDQMLTDAGVEHYVKEYPAAGHSFLNDQYFGPGVLHPIQRIGGMLGPDPSAAADAWARIDAFFAQHLSAEG